MAHGTSADGNLISYRTVGKGEPIVTLARRASGANGATEPLAVPESHDRSIDPVGTAREIRRRLVA